MSGKGGTGKTTLAGSLADLAARDRQLVLADLDVDAANLELLVQPSKHKTHPFQSGKMATINQDLCTQCGNCLEACRFDAVLFQNNKYLIIEDMCEGCLSCFYQCPVNAVQISQSRSGEWYQSTSLYGELFHASLFPGAENSGKLVTQVKSAAAQFCEEKDCELLLLDGPPGTGCPVTAASQGADLAILVSEPTTSGMHDLVRILKVMRHFRVPAYLVINKADLNLNIRNEILETARQNQLPLLGEIPYDESIIVLQSQAKPLTSVCDSAATDAIRMIWRRFENVLDGKSGVKNYGG